MPVPRKGDASAAPGAIELVVPPSVSPAAATGGNFGDKRDGWMRVCFNWSRRAAEMPRLDECHTKAPSLRLYRHCYCTPSAESNGNLFSGSPRGK